MKSKVFLLGTASLLLGACSQDNEIVKPKPTPGQEVKFGVSLGKSDLTRTVYGTEHDNAFPIYWVQDDKVLVTSPQCMTGRSTAEYKVTVAGDKQNYATSLDKTGAYGLQWGKAATADFYSVYPSQDAEATGSTFSLYMPEGQNDQVSADNSTVSADMNACFMYARTLGVANGGDVDLRYKPLSTAIRFTLRGPSPSTAGKDDQVTVSRVTLKAPVAISGEFTVDVSGEEPEVKLGSRTFKEVQIQTTYASGGYLTLKTGEEVELNAFIIPQKDVTIDDTWQVEVTLAGGSSYLTSLKGSVTGAGKTNKLIAGQVHRLGGRLPALNIDLDTWDASNWMANIPRNVYLSEISLPGSWNSLNNDFQDVKGTNAAQQKAAIQAQYNAGARVFHIDTRWKASREYTVIPVWTYTLTGLSVANGAATYSPGSSGAAKVMQNGNVSFSDVLGYVTGEVKDDEYMVVVCSFAQNSYEETTGAWMKAVSEACANNAKVLDASKISPETVVGQVLGKVIVIVNCESALADVKSQIPASSKCLFVYNSQMLNQNGYQTDKYFEGPMWAGQNTVGLNLYSTQAQAMAPSSYDNGTGIYNSKRGYAPSMKDRKEKSGNILAWSEQNYGKADYLHCDWLYHGLGGYRITSTSDDGAVSGSYQDVANTLNLWMDGKIQNMSANPTGEQTKYFPVGIVLMNYVTDATYGVPVMKDILMLNNKYRKAYDPNRSPIDGSLKNSSSDISSAAPGYDSGMKDEGVNAISWTRSR